MIHDDNESTTAPAADTSPFKKDVNDIQRRHHAEFVALIAAADGALSATFSDAPYDLHVIVVALRSIADALEEQDKKAKAAKELTMKHGAD
jgi:hypothetical protein